jgi:hypothetical protein
MKREEPNHNVFRNRKWLVRQKDQKQEQKNEEKLLFYFVK